MKSLYSLIQRFGFELCIFFGVCPLMPVWLQKFYGYDSHIPAIYSGVLLLSGLVTFGLCLLWLKSRFILEKPGYMAALTAASLLGVMIGFSALLGILGFGSKLYLIWREIPSWILMALMMPGIFWQFANTRR